MRVSLNKFKHKGFVAAAGRLKQAAAVIVRFLVKKTKHFMRTNTIKQDVSAFLLLVFQKARVAYGDRSKTIDISCLVFGMVLCWVAFANPFPGIIFGVACALCFHHVEPFFRSATKTAFTEGE